MEITSLLFDLSYKFELIGASLLALAKFIYYAMKENKKKKNNFVVRVLKTIQILANVFSHRGCQENPT